MTRLRHIPFIGHYFDNLYFLIHDWKMDRISERDQTHPITLIDEYLGTFSYIRNYSGGSFHMTRLWGRHKVKITLGLNEGSPEPDMEKAAKLAVKARVLWENQPDWESRIKSAVFDEFYANLDRNRDGSPSLSEKEFLKEIELEAIGVTSNEKFYAWSSLPGFHEDSLAEVTGSLSGGELCADYLG